jgi:hypothetical protein
VNFSKNNLGDDAIGRLLQALQRSELHVTSLNLAGNRLGTAAARHISDFLWQMSTAVREVILSHNEFNDEAALEMLRLVVDHPKYQPRKAREGAGHGELLHPVWLRLDYNRIDKPRKLLRTLENELGACICLARNRNVCGLQKCGWRGGQGHTLMHLFNFECQESSASALAQPGSAATWRKEQSELDGLAEPCVHKERELEGMRNDCNPTVAGFEAEELCDKTLKPHSWFSFANKSEAKRRPASNATQYPHLRGVPEVTPEPDGTAPHSLLHVSGRMPKLREASDEEEEEAAPPRADTKVQFKAPPKILQRGMAPPPEVVLRSGPDAAEQVS